MSATQALLLNIPGAGALPIIDPYGCEEFGGAPDLFAMGTVPGLEIGFCGFDFGKFYSDVTMRAEQMLCTQTTSSITILHGRLNSV